MTNICSLLTIIIFLTRNSSFTGKLWMKIKKEIVCPILGHHLNFLHPRLKNYFFWHYHPEYELVYVEASNGIRHVGQHISSFMESDLVLIGPNIPHLKF